MICARVVLLAIVGATALPAAAQPRDRTPPSAPAQLRVTAFNSYSVSLTWNPSTDDSGRLTYQIQASGYPGGTVNVPQGSHAFTFTPATGVTAGYRYSFTMWAVDPSGNRSKSSNTTPVVTLPADTVAPTAPVLSVTQTTASTVALSWTAAVDDGPYVSYVVGVNGSQTVAAGGATSITINGLTPLTAYTFVVAGRDNWQNWSPSSNEVNVTTAAADSNDTTAPSVPTGLSAWDFGGSEPEIWVFWTQSTDNSDPQSVLKYEVWVNGRLDHLVIGRGQTVLYGDPNGAQNRISISAVDVAGNRSAAASITCNRGVCQ